MDTDHIIAAIEASAARAGVEPGTICRRAVNHGRLYERLKAGESCTLRTAKRLIEYIKGQPDE